MPFEAARDDCRELAQTDTVAFWVKEVPNMFPICLPLGGKTEGKETQHLLYKYKDARILGVIRGGKLLICYKLAGFLPVY